MTEFAFLHRRSATLVLTDLIENFERAKPDCVLRGIARPGGVLDPDGRTPRDLRLTFRRHQREIREDVETMTGWGLERIVLAHRRWQDRDGAAQLARAFRWALA